MLAAYMAVTGSTAMQFRILKFSVIALVSRRRDKRNRLRAREDLELIRSPELACGCRRYNQTP